MKPTHSQRLENWLGTKEVEDLSDSMRDWYGPPIAVHGVPGAVFAVKGGDFIGHVEAGQFGSKLDYAEDLLHRMGQKLRACVARGARVQHGTLHAGFTSLSDLIAEATGGKRLEFVFYKIGVTGVAGVTNSLWGVNGQPGSGAVSAAAAAGDTPSNGTVGAYDFGDVSPDTRHIVSAGVNASVLGNTLLLYDRIFSVAKILTVVTAESVTGVPARYQSTTAGAADSAEGNFLFVEVGVTALAATAHNWTVCLYTDQGGTSGATLPSLTGNSGAIARRLDHPVQQWFAPLATGDTGIQQLDQMQQSASLATGVANFVIGHPIAWMPCPIANLVCMQDYINTAFNLARIFDDAALAFLEVHKPTTTATTYNGSFTTVSG